jgi:GNAT superfamily N-acetyltransferase
LADSSRLAVIDVLYVEPGAREVSVGESLLAVLVDWARTRGATALDASVLPGMRQAKSFLEGSGFAARLLVMHQRLD